MAVQGTLLTLKFPKDNEQICETSITYNYAKARGHVSFFMFGHSVKSMLHSGGHSLLLICSTSERKKNSLQVFGDIKVEQV